MMQEAEAEDGLDSAVRRLERATALLESRLDSLVQTVSAAAGGFSPAFLRSAEVRNEGV